jgi:hypothetical protein
LYDQSGFLKGEFGNETNSKYDLHGIHLKHNLHVPMSGTVERCSEPFHFLKGGVLLRKLNTHQLLKKSFNCDFMPLQNNIILFPKSHILQNYYVFEGIWFASRQGFYWFSSGSPDPCQEKASK